MLYIKAGFFILTVVICCIMDALFLSIWRFFLFIQRFYETPLYCLMFHIRYEEFGLHHWEFFPFTFFKQLFGNFFLNISNSLASASPYYTHLSAISFYICRHLFSLSPSMSSPDVKIREAAMSLCSTAVIYEGSQGRREWEGGKIEGTGKAAKPDRNSATLPPSGLEVLRYCCLNKVTFLMSTSDHKGCFFSDTKGILHKIKPWWINTVLFHVSATYSSLFLFGF